MNKIVHKSTSNLPRLLSLLPKDGLNSIVYQTRWKGKGIPTPDSASNLAGASYWDVLLVKHSYNDAGKVTGKAYGVLYWKGKRVTDESKTYEKIRGGLKYNWASTSTPPLLEYSPKPKAVESTEA